MLTRMYLPSMLQQRVIPVGLVLVAGILCLIPITDLGTVKRHELRPVRRVDSGTSTSTTSSSTNFEYLPDIDYRLRLKQTGQQFYP